MDPDPYVRWQLGADVPAVRHGGAVALVHDGRWGRTVTVLGPAADQPDALAAARDAARRAGDPEPVRVLAHPDAVAALGLAPQRRWQWMLHAGPSPAAPAGVGWLDRGWRLALETFLGEHSPDAFAQPGDPDVHGWAGVLGHQGVEDGTLLATGAAVRSPAGWPHLRAIVTRPEARGRGLGTAVSTFLTADALARTGVCSLSVYTDNAVAVRVYERLGFVARHQLVGAALSSTSASRPVP